MIEISWVYSLWPNNSIWWHRSGSIWAQVMACCLTTPSHNLNWCWLIAIKLFCGIHLRAISREVLMNFIRTMCLEVIFSLKLDLYLPVANESEKEILSAGSVLKRMIGYQYSSSSCLPMWLVSVISTISLWLLLSDTPSGLSMTFDPQEPDSALSLSGICILAQLWSSSCRIKLSLSSFCYDIPFFQSQMCLHYIFPAYNA